jgi:hypothetical protein
MRRLLPLLWIVLMTAASRAAAGGHDPIRFDATRYAELLRTHTKAGTIGGVSVVAVDYGALAKQAGDPTSLYRHVLDDFARFDPTALGTPSAREAFWMNAYNIGAIKLVVDHYPVDSITSRKINLFGSPWSKEVLAVGGKVYSLDGIEHGILLDRFRDIRTHWAIVCASVSCPSLRREPFEPERLDAQLDEQGRDFWNDPNKGARVDRKNGRLTVTAIHKFFRGQFEEWGGGIAKVMAPYLEDPADRVWIEKEGWKLETFDYDWSLNDTARLDR